jgi:hypothetical protein
MLLFLTELQEQLSYKTVVCVCVYTNVCTHVCSYVHMYIVKYACVHEYVNMCVLYMINIHTYNYNIKSLE